MTWQRDHAPVVTVMQSPGLAHGSHVDTLSQRSSMVGGLCQDYAAKFSLALSTWPITVRQPCAKSRLCSFYHPPEFTISNADLYKS